jgi:AmiR/NasT family two-component response regulator
MIVASIRTAAASPTPNCPGFKEASRRGIFAYITDAEAKDWQSSIDIVLRRFTEYHEGAFGRRAMTERAKGILMERHSVDKEATFEIAA